MLSPCPSTILSRKPLCLRTQVSLKHKMKKNYLRWIQIRLGRSELPTNLTPPPYHRWACSYSHGLSPFCALLSSSRAHAHWSIQQGQAALGHSLSPDLPKASHWSQLRSLPPSLQLYSATDWAAPTWAASSTPSSLGPPTWPINASSRT